jgi:hypothetical protein
MTVDTFEYGVRIEDAGQNLLVRQHVGGLLGLDGA